MLSIPGACTSAILYSFVYVASTPGYRPETCFYIGQANMMPVFIIINWTQFFMLPALTMKSIADEKKERYNRTHAYQTC